MRSVFRFRLHLAGGLLVGAIHGGIKKGATEC
jgi:hypothetical protein